MLAKLNVMNFAIIDYLSIDFKKGFTALTGETGAGKSLIIDAIGLILGNRSSVTMIRTGETKATVEGFFEMVSDNTKQALNALSIELFEDDTVIIKRELTLSGKSLIRVNGEIITLNQLEVIASTLGDIHTQDDTHKLFDPKNYLTFIENEEIKQALKVYQLSCRNYFDQLKKYHELEKLATLDQSNLDFWQFQLNELEKANLKLFEMENLQEELAYLNNYENIFQNLTSIIQTFDEHNILDNLYETLNNLDKLQKYQKDYQHEYDTVSNSYYELEEVINKVKNHLNHLEFDETRLNEINERISYLNSLKHKYNKDIKELIAFKAELKAKIDDFNQVDYKITDQKNMIKKSFLDLKTKALNLTNLRKLSAENLEKHVLISLKDLMLNKVEFKIVFNSYHLTDEMDSRLFKPNGCDEIDMMISFNVGEPVKSLSKVASGGEMSRIMLALKEHFLTNIKLSTMIFDEIDSGVSGIIAKRVGEKLKAISLNTQVLTITHLPIVASLADHQYQIFKETIDNRTKTNIKELSFDERINIIGEMISPNDVTNKGKELALEMLKQNC